MKMPEETSASEQQAHERELNRPFKIPDKDLSREGWLDIVKPAYLRRGHTDYLLHQEADTTLRKSRAATQNYWLSRRSFGMPDGYERIFRNGRRAAETGTNSASSDEAKQ